MKVMKFGGTSVGSPSRMKEVVNLVTKSVEPVHRASAWRTERTNCRMYIQQTAGSEG